MTKTTSLAAIVFACAGCATTSAVALKPVQTVESLDVRRYAGTWYEISAIPQQFEPPCASASADYSMREDGQLNVVSRCKSGGVEKVTQGVARILDRTTNARFEISFNGPFWKEYLIIDLSDNYDFAVMANSQRDELKVLSRTPRIDAFAYLRILGRVAKQGFDVSRLERRSQGEVASVGGK